MEQSETQEQRAVLTKIGSHPLRPRILSMLNMRVASPNELSRMLGEKLGDVSYHVRVLRGLDAIELLDTKQRRGATEHYYKAKVRPLLGKDEVAQMSLEERRDFISYGLQLMHADQQMALSEGTLGRRDETHVSRTPGFVDEQGWRELAEIFDDAFDKAFDVIAKSGGRGEATIPVVVGLTLFETPAPPES
jgi:DNA-binding transcriptional ArsR family regulator